MTHAWLVAILDRFPAKGVEVLGRLALGRAFQSGRVQGERNSIDDSASAGRTRESDLRLLSAGFVGSRGKRRSDSLVRPVLARLLVEARRMG